MQRLGEENRNKKKMEIGCSQEKKNFICVENNQDEQNLMERENNERARHEKVTG